MESVKSVQVKPLKIKILGFLVFAIFVYLFFFGNPEVLQLCMLFVIGVLLFGYSVVYEINQDFNNYKLFCLFNFTCFKIKLKLDYPEYISVFATAKSGDNEWGTVSALGTQERYEFVIVRFFSGTKKFTVFESSSYDKAINKAELIGSMLNVEIYDTTKN